MDFEDILKYFRVSMPKKYLDEEEYKKLINSALGFRVRDLFFVLVILLSLSVHPSFSPLRVKCVEQTICFRFQSF